MAVTEMNAVLPRVAQDVLDGLSRAGQKTLPSRFLYDDLGSVLFDAITLLPEYGLTRADERLLQRCSSEIADAAGTIGIATELGSGSGKKTRYLMEAVVARAPGATYYPIDVSAAALAACEKEIGDILPVRSICAEWLPGLRRVLSPGSRERALVLFLGSTIGNLERRCIPEFLTQLREQLAPGDLFLLGADLVKDVETMLVAYDDPTGVTASFNLNILGRLNREFGSDFNLRNFAHEVKWDKAERRIEMHLVSCSRQTVNLPGAPAPISFEAGETIWTESSHKFTEQELAALAYASGFTPVNSWTDREWPFAEVLWRA
jgi:L-histidine Nalpha-methyltransferase